MMTLPPVRQKAMWAAVAASAVFFVLILLCILNPQAAGGAVAPLAAAAGGLLVLSTALAAKIQNDLSRQRHQAAYCDALTGLGNELLLKRDFDRMKDRGGHAFVLFRLNGFSWLNLLFGMRRGAEMVRRLAPLIQEFAAAHQGTAYRVAINYFAMLILLPEDQKAEQELLDRFFSELEEVTVQDSHVSYSYHYTYSYAAYRMGSRHNTPEAARRVMATAGVALLQNENDSSTSGVVLDCDSCPDEELRELLSGSIAQAWKNREFVPYYQLVYDLASGRPVGAELLTRWIFPGRGIIMPRDFVPVMEEQGLIMDLDLYMLEEACKKIKKWIDDELVTVPLSINISKLNVHRANFVEMVIGVVEKYDIPPVLIELELNESVVLFEKTDTFIDLVDRLHRFGFTLSMDHFAETDFSSINLLRNLEIDVVKVSPNFFSGVESSERKRIFVSSAIAMFQKLGIKVIASNMETEEQLALCRKFGCDLAQGYYFSRPIPNEEFEQQIF